jgi:hypothetical protein
MELINDIGYREGAGHKLVSVSAAAEFERAWRVEVRSARTEDLVQERDPLWLLLLAKHEADPSEDPLNVDDSQKLTLAVLRNAWSEAKRQAMGSRAVRRSPLLAWDSLIELYGDEATLKERIGTLKATQPQGHDHLLELADKYLGG